MPTKWKTIKSSGIHAFVCRFQIYIFPNAGFKNGAKRIQAYTNCNNFNTFFKFKNNKNGVVQKPTLFSSQKFKYLKLHFVC